MNILHIEDSREDARLIRALLTEEWPDCSIKVVDNRAAVIESLEGREGDYDVVLSDFSLGSFTGLDALAIVREKRPTTPFIFISGTIGEDRAIEALRAGAQDYVLKDRMKRLITAIYRSQRECEERRQRQAAEKTMARFALLLETTPDFIGMAALDGRFFYVNRAGLEMAGLPSSHDPGSLHLADLHSAEANEYIRSEGIPAATRDGAWIAETDLMARGGRRVPVSEIIIAHQASDGADAYLSVIIHDLTGHHDAERRIREQADLLNRARDAIIVTDLGGQVTFWNMGAERLSGWTSEESVGRSLRDVLGFEGHSEIDMAAKALEGAEEWRGEFRLNSKLGKLYVLEISATLIRDDDGRPKAHLYIGTDVTAKKSLEEQFLRAQRLESIGMLASGIAHDLNNVLAPILLAAPMLRSRATNPADLRMIATLEKSAERGAGLVRQILGFAHGVGGTQQALQVKHLVRDTASVVAETFPKNIALDDSVAADLWPVLANPTQIHQVLLNLCVNARDAMPQGGTLVLRAENCLLDDAAAATIKGASPGAWTVLHVQDSGTGIPAEILEHIWEPFYTTKGIGKGTGLGLSTVRGIVENHRGFIELRTEPGAGTTFRVYLPAAKDPSRGEKAGSVHPFEARGAGELILIVDDEAQIRDVAAAILKRFGYRAVVAADGNEALSVFAARAGEISMLITDLSMPNLDGLSLARQVLKLKPETKVLAMSGLASGDVHAGIQQYAGALLAKPFTADELLGAVTRLLREARAPGG